MHSKLLQKFCIAEDASYSEDNFGSVEGRVLGKKLFYEIFSIECMVLIRIIH